MLDRQESYALRCVGGLEHQDGLTQIPVGLHGNRSGQLGRQGDALLLADRLQGFGDLQSGRQVNTARLALTAASAHKNKQLRWAYLVERWSGNSDHQASRADRINYLAMDHSRSSVCCRFSAREQGLFFRTLEVELQQRMRRHTDMYFSIVRRRACWASLDNRSTSFSTTTGEVLLRHRSRSNESMCREGMYP